MKPMNFLNFVQFQSYRAVNKKTDTFACQLSEVAKFDHLKAFCNVECIYKICQVCLET